MQHELQNRKSLHDVRKRLGTLAMPAALHIAVDLPSTDQTVRRVLPFRRAWIWVLMTAAIDAAVMIPAVITYGRVVRQWQALDSLFDLTSAVFMTAWLVGWSVAPLIISFILMMLVAGREVLSGRPGVLRIGLGIPGLILAMDYAVDKVANLRLTHPENKSGSAWRGTHLSFDYDDRRIDFGSAMTAGDLLAIKQDIESVTQSGTAEAERRYPYEAVQDALSAQAVINASEAGNASAPITLTSPSTLALIASNLVTVAGALFFGWRLADVMVLYWAESAVIALFNVAKIAYIGKWAGVIAGIFFLAHFSGFMAVHFLFIYGIFIEGMRHTGGGDLKAVADLFLSLWPALAALFVSHGLSFVTNFIGRKEYRRKTVREQMTAPYGRIVLMHVTLILGGLVTMILRDPQPVLLAFILVKILMDVRAHLKEHAVNEALG